MSEQPSQEKLNRLVANARRILLDVVRCAACDKELTGLRDLDRAEVLEELRDEGWVEVGGWWLCNECGEDGQ